MSTKTEINYRQAFRLALLGIIFLSSTLAFLLFNSPAIAQRPGTSSSSATLEFIGKTQAAASFRLNVKDNRNIVFVYCPQGFEATLGYLRNTQAIQCQSVTR